MNLTLYAITAFIILDTDGNRVLSKYYRQENNPSSSKGLANTKEQRAFEKGLWQKTKKSGGAFMRRRPHPFYPDHSGTRIEKLTWDRCSLGFPGGDFWFDSAPYYRRHHSLRRPFGGIQTLAGPHLLLDRQPRRERADDKRGPIGLL